MNRSLIDVQFHKIEGDDSGRMTAMIEITNLTDEPFRRVAVDWKYRIASSKRAGSKDEPAKPSEQVMTLELPSVDDDGALPPSATRQFFFGPDDLKQLLSVIAAVSSDQVAVVIRVELSDGAEWQETISGQKLGLWVDRAIDAE